MSENEEEVIVASAAYDVPTDNYEEFDQEIDPAKLGDKLVQSNSQKGLLREFQIYDRSHLLVSDGDITGDDVSHYRVNLAWVDAEPKHLKLIDWNWLYAALFFGTITATFVILAITQNLTMDYSMIGGTISFTITMLATLIFIYKLRDEFTFQSYFGGADLFVLENKRPTQTIFDNFFVSLQQAIDHAHAEKSVNDRLVGELKMCRRLRDEGVIDDEVYTAARAVIFKHEQYTA